MSAAAAALGGRHCCHALASSRCNAQRRIATVSAACTLQGRQATVGRQLQARCVALQQQQSHSSSLQSSSQQQVNAKHRQQVVAAASAAAAPGSEDAHAGALSVGVVERNCCMTLLADCLQLHCLLAHRNTTSRDIVGLECHATHPIGNVVFEHSCCFLAVGTRAAPHAVVTPSEIWSLHCPLGCMHRHDSQAHLHLQLHSMWNQ
jgi:hypothetical protein